jgi:hypothetical protein
MRFLSLPWLIRLSLIAVLATPAVAEGSHDRTQFGHDISVGSDEEVAEVTCFGCSVRIRGHVDGDVTTFGGSIVLERDAKVGGDTTSFAGDVRLDSGAKVKDVTIFGARFHRDPQASVGGDVTTFAGGGALWLFLIFGLPFVILGAIIALIVWLIGRSRRPALPVAARV